MCRFILLIAGLLCIASCRSAKEPHNGDQALHLWFEQKSDSLVAELIMLDTLSGSGSPGILKRQYQACRYRYKQLEGFAEYFFPNISRRVNGPALPDVRTDDNQVFPPYGFQVIEQYLWGDFHDSMRVGIQEEVRRIQIDIRYMQTQLESQTLLPRHVRELTHEQLIRIGTLGLAGFDAPLSGDFRLEASAALNGIFLFLKAYAAAEKGAAIPDHHFFRKASDLLNIGSDFDVLYFLTDVLMPLGEQLRAVPFPETDEDRQFGKTFRGTLADLLTGKGFFPDQLAGYAAGKATEDKRILGEKLFYDPLLSRSATISCASCHKPQKAFTDGLPKAANLVHGGSLPRNTPTLFYSSLQTRQFYDLRSGSLEDQVDQVMHNEDEFGWYSDQAAKRISGIPGYAALIRKAYYKDTLEGLELRNALATYVRSLNPFRSAFDAYMKGDRSAMTREQRMGFNVFIGKGKCGTCHFLPVFNGTIPPGYNRTESEVIGIPAVRFRSKPVIDADPGRYALHAVEPFRYAFKTPTVRNVEQTWPYMHNGVYITLEEVVDFYNNGGGIGIGIELYGQSLPANKLDLTEAEENALLSFLRSLSDQ